MHVSVRLNPKHESFMVTAFFEMLANSGHQVNLVFDETDLKPDADGTQAVPTLENLGVDNYRLHLVNSVVFVDRKNGTMQKTLHEKSRFLSK